MVAQKDVTPNLLKYAIISCFVKYFVRTLNTPKPSSRVILNSVSRSPAFTVHRNEAEKDLYLFNLELMFSNSFLDT